MGSQKESPELRERGKHEGEITDIDPVLDHLVEQYFLPVPLFYYQAAHRSMSLP